MPEHTKELKSSGDIEISDSLSAKAVAEFLKLDLWFEKAHNLILKMDSYDFSLVPKNARGGIETVCPNYYNCVQGDIKPSEFRKRIGMDPKYLRKVEVLEIGQGFSSYKIPTENGAKILYIYSSYDSVSKK